MASDSRFGGGERWDACAKIFDIGRSDALLGFAGDTWRGLPLIFQILATTRSYSGSQLRTLDLPKYASHLERVLNSVLEKAYGPAAEKPPGCEFQLGGWSWTEGRFMIYQYRFNQGKWKFELVRKRAPARIIQSPGRVRIDATIGDGSSNITGRIARDYNQGVISGRINYHPLEALYQQTIDPNIDSVGGPLQVAKVYRSIRVEHFATRANGHLYIAGRPLLSYENINLRTIARSDDGTWAVEPQAVDPSQ